jgi:hypothetical protein
MSKVFLAMALIVAVMPLSGLSIGGSFAPPGYEDVFAAASVPITVMMLVLLWAKRASIQNLAKERVPTLVAALGTVPVISMALYTLLYRIVVVSTEFGGNIISVIFPLPSPPALEQTLREFGSREEVLRAYGPEYINQIGGPQRTIPVLLLLLFYLLAVAGASLAFGFFAVYLERFGKRSKASWNVHIQSASGLEVKFSSTSQLDVAQVETLLRVLKNAENKLPVEESPSVPRSRREQQ